MIRKHDRKMVDARKLSVKFVKLSIKYLIESFSLPVFLPCTKGPQMRAHNRMADVCLKANQAMTIIKSAGVAEKERFEDRFDGEINVIN